MRRWRAGPFAQFLAVYCAGCFVIMGDASNDTQRTLWIGDLGYWMDENFLYSLFAGTGTVTSVKIIRSKATNVSEGYGFIEFSSHEAASQVRTLEAGAAPMHKGCRPECRLPSPVIGVALMIMHHLWPLPNADFDNLQRMPYSGH